MSDFYGDDDSRAFERDENRMQKPLRREDLDAGPDVSESDELAGECEVVARITNAETPEPWEVYDVRSNSTGVYYVLNVKSTGGLIVPTTVKHSTRHNKFICMTHKTNDACAHARFVRRWVKSHTESKAS